MVLWAGNFIVVKSAVAVLPPVGFTFLRFASRPRPCSSCFDGARARSACPRRDLIAICGLGAMGFGIYQILWTTGLRRSPPATPR